MIRKSFWWNVGCILMWVSWMVILFMTPAMLSETFAATNDNVPYAIIALLDFWSLLILVGIPIVWVTVLVTYDFENNRNYNRFIWSDANHG